MNDPIHDIELLIRSRYGIIALDTVEEDRAEGLLRHLADHLGLPLFVWTRTKGLRRSDQPAGIYGTAEPARALDHVEAAGLPAIYVFQGLGPYLADDVIARKLQDAAATFAERRGALVLIGPGLELPEILRPMGATITLPGPAPAEYRDLLERIVRDLRARAAITVEISQSDLERLLANLKGLTLLEAEKILTRIIVEDGRLSPEDIRKVVDAKRQIVEREGLLEYYPVEESMAEVADLVGLKGWLAQRTAMVAQPGRAAEFGLSFPKGVLLLGVPGCGKSLCAKAVATEWALPLLKLDPSNLYNKYVGESERNFKRAITAAERMAPVVLWIDELEKAFAVAGGDEDGGVSLRILGTFLSWLQDRRGDVFVVATANDVSRLAPEFLRKGRFDEIFFVDLPDTATREAILRIHLRKRGKDPARFDLPALAAATTGFSGAELEQVVVSALYAAFSAGDELATDHLLREAARTHPLSRTMAERIDALRAWARGRTVPAN